MHTLCNAGNNSFVFLFSPLLSLSSILCSSLSLSDVLFFFLPILTRPLVSITLSLQNDELQVKLSRSRDTSVLEVDKGIQEKTERFQKEKQTLLEQNKQLRMQLEKMNAEKEQVSSSQQDQEAELNELRQNKELLTQWEKQIADIIQWVTEEKDARWVWFHFPCKYSSM